MLEAYLSALNRHDLAAALERLAPDVVFTNVERTWSLQRAEVEGLLAWDAALRSRMRCERFRERGDRAQAIFRETNDLLGLLGIDERRYRLTFTVRAGRIVEQVIEPLAGEGPTDADALAPAIAWARNEEPAELDAIYPEGRMVLDGDSARRWVALLERWRAGQRL